MEGEDLEVVANHILLKGSEYHLKGDMGKARKFYSVGHGMFKYLENRTGLELAVNLLILTGANREYLLELEKWGCDFFLYVLKHFKAEELKRGK